MEDLTKKQKITLIIVVILLFSLIGSWSYKSRQSAIKSCIEGNNNKIMCENALNR